MVRRLVWLSFRLQRAFRARTLLRGAAIVLLAPSILCGQDDVQPGRFVALNFEWPVGVSATIDLSEEQTYQQGYGADTVRFTATYAMEVEEHPRGRAIRFETTSPIRVADANIERQAFLQQLLTGAGAIPTAYIVDRDGILLGVEGLGAIRREAIRALERALSEAFAEFGPLPPEIRGLMEAIITEEMLYAEAAEQWGSLVTFWDDVEIAAGLPYQIETTGPVPVFPGHGVAYHDEFSLLDGVDCATGTPRPGAACVALRLDSRPDPGALQATLDRIVPPLLVDGEPQGSRMSLDYTVSVRSTAEPESLLPYSAEIRRSLDVRGGPGGTYTQSHVIRYTYSYGD